MGMMIQWLGKKMGEAHALPSMDDRREGWCRLRYMTCWPSVEDQWKL